MKYAFQCKNCGHLEPAGVAGEREKPRACSICGAGIKHTVNEAGTQHSQVEDPDNWIVLADATDKELKALGLAAKDIEVHKPVKATESGRKAKRVAVTAQENVGAEDVSGGEKS